MDKVTLEDRIKELERVIYTMRQRKPSLPCIEGITDSERHFLLLISDLAQEIEFLKPSDLAQKTGITMAGITHQIKALEAAGFIKRAVRESNRREVIISLTAAGKSQIEKIKKSHWQKMRELINYLGDEDSAKFIQIINKISNFMSNNR